MALMFLRHQSVKLFKLLRKVGAVQSLVCNGANAQVHKAGDIYVWGSILVRVIVTLV